MPDGLEETQSVFEKAIDPSPRHEPPTQPRNSSGQFIATAEKPEPFLEIRTIEGDPDTGDTDDGGDDPRLVSREREIADGRFDSRQEQPQRRRGEQGGDAATVAADGEHEGADAEQGDDEAQAAGDEEGSEEGTEDLEKAQFEITVDGAPTTVTLGELRDGYIRTATFHSRLNKVQEQRNAVEQENQRVA